MESRALCEQVFLFHAGGTEHVTIYALRLLVQRPPTRCLHAKDEETGSKAANDNVAWLWMLTAVA
jgi:hypothetical protein